MAQAQLKLTTASGAELAVGPRWGRTGATGIFLPRDGQDQLLPLPDYTETFVESANSEGGPLVQSAPKNAVGTGSVIISGDDAASFRQWHGLWQQMIEALRKEGGKITYRPPDGVDVTYVVESAKISTGPYDGLKAQAYVQEFGFQFTCLPYGLLSQEEATVRDHDPFSRDTIGAGEWAAFDSGSGTLEVSTNRLKPTSTSEKRLYRYGLKAADSAATIRVDTGASVASGAVAIMAKRVDTNNRLNLQLNFAGAASNLNVRAVNAGAEASRVASPSFTTTANTTYWLRGTAEGSTVKIELFTADPDTGAKPAQAVTWALAGEDAAKFGENVWAGWGLRMASLPATDWAFGEWRWDAKLFRSTSPLVDLEVPGVRGHVAAQAELLVADTAGQARRFAEYGLEEAGDYDPGRAPPNIVDSDQLVTAGFAGAQATRAGSYDPLASGNNVVRATITNVPQVVCSTGPQAHGGKYRIKARVHLDPREGQTAVGPAFVRHAVAASPAGPFTRGEWQEVPISGAWALVDLGVAEPPGVTQSGSQAPTWEVRVEAMTNTVGDTVDIDFVEFLGGGRYGKSRGELGLDVPTVTTAQDAFNQAGSGLSELNGKQIGSASPESVTKSSGEGNLVTQYGTGTPGPFNSPVEWTNLALANGSNPLLSEGAQVGSTSFGPSGEPPKYFRSYGVTKTLSWYKFNVGVPLGVAIKGIKVEITRTGVNGSAYGRDYDQIMQLGTGKETPVGTNKNGTMWPLPGFYTSHTQTFGGENDTWGRAWTPAEINAEGFSVHCAAIGWIVGGNAEEGTSSPHVNAVTITVYYQPSGAVTWHESGGTASTSAIQLNAGTHVAERISNTVSDGSVKGRLATAGNAAGQILKSAVVQADVLSTGVFQYTGVATRIRGTGAAANFVAFGVQPVEAGGRLSCSMIKASESGAYSTYFGATLSKTQSQWLTLRMLVEADGRWAAWADEILLAQGFDKSLSEGAWAEGLSGIYSQCVASGSVAGSVWDNFSAWSPEARAVVNAGQALAFRSGDAIRQNAGSETWSPAPGYKGGRLLVPPAGPGRQTSRLAVQARRADVDQAADEWIADEVQVGLRLTPRVVLLG